MNIVEFLSSPTFCESEYVVGLVPKQYDENDCTCFTMWASFYNSDWMMDYVQTWARKFPDKEIVIYRRTVDEKCYDKFSRLYKGSARDEIIKNANPRNVYYGKWFNEVPLN